MIDFSVLIRGGLDALSEYLSAHVLTCLIPAFFIAGAIDAFISKGAVLKYFGAKAKKYISYGVASISGTILAVCSCTVIPLFAGIYMQGAGLGPAITFLYSGPAINLLAIIYTARLIGLDIGLARAIGAIVFSIVLGLAMAFLYRGEEMQRQKEIAVMPSNPDDKSGGQLFLYFAVLVGILVFGAAGYIDRTLKMAVLFVLFIALGAILKNWFTRAEIDDWVKKTYLLLRMIVPLLLLGVFLAGAIKALIPEEVITLYLGGNSLRSNFVASLFGALMYFATLTEVPIIMALMELGMGRGPALALLLAGPALSLPNMLAIKGVLGTKKTLTYAVLVVVTATFSGLVFGTFWG